MKAHNVEKPKTYHSGHRYAFLVTGLAFEYLKQTNTVARKVVANHQLAKAFHCSEASALLSVRVQNPNTQLITLCFSGINESQEPFTVQPRSIGKPPGPFLWFGEGLI